MRKKTVILKGLSMTVFFATEGMVVSNICNRKSQSIKYSWKGKRFKLSLSRVDFRQPYWISCLKIRQIATDDLNMLITMSNILSQGCLDLHYPKPNPNPTQNPDFEPLTHPKSKSDFRQALLRTSAQRVPDTRPEPDFFSNTRSIPEMFSESSSISGFGYLRNYCLFPNPSVIPFLVIRTSASILFIS